MVINNTPFAIVSTASQCFFVFPSFNSLFFRFSTHYFFEVVSCSILHYLSLRDLLVVKANVSLR